MQFRRCRMAKMSQNEFKVPARSRRRAEKNEEKPFVPPVVPNRKLQLPTLPPERPVTRGAVRAWQEGSDKPWSELPGLRLKFKDGVSSTSDYGTASELSSQSFVSNSSHDVCSCENMSGIGVVSSDDERLNMDDLKNSLEECAWSSAESEGEAEVKVEKESEWEDDDRPTARVLSDPESRVTAIIPASSARKLKNAELKILDEEKYKPKLRKLDRLCAPIICLGPHGMQFEDGFRVYLSIPVLVHDEKLIACLYSDTGEHEVPKWERLPEKSFKYKDGFVILIVSHLSLFTVILEEPYPERLKRIRKRNGGILRIEDIPGVEVAFPRGCLEDDIDAYLRVIFDTDAAVLPQNVRQKYSLASPIIMIGPHGLQFPSCRPVVTITLPVPDLQKICSLFHVKDVLKALTVWHSPTKDLEPVGWKKLKTEISLDLKHASGLPVVSFKVQHFSFFTVFWDIISSSLYEAKIGMAHFANFVTFSMMCEAFMQETPNKNKFCLEVICYRSDRKLPDVTNLQHRVGAINKPKLLKPGRVFIRLKSNMFEADTNAGEEVEMCKEEPEFKGRDFEKQYACRFKDDADIETGGFGAFGKVLVERGRLNGGRNDLAFEFNLFKTGNESEINIANNGEKWTIVAIKELAEHLQITEDNNWKTFARRVGFTNSEIRTKLEVSGDPFLAMTNIYTNRGGTPEEFVQALVSVSRDIAINKFNNTPPSSSTGSASPTNSASGSHKQSSPFSKFWLWNKERRAQESPDREVEDVDEGMPPPADRRRNTSKKSSKGSSSNKRSQPGSGKSSSKRQKSEPPNKKKRRNVPSSSSSASEPEASSDEEDGYRRRSPSVKSSAKEYRLNSRRLTDTDLWKASECMDNTQWRVLGRNLGLEETTINNIDQTHKCNGFRECAYQVLLRWKCQTAKKCTLGTLYKALEDSKMKEAAKFVVAINFGEAV